MEELPALPTQPSTLAATPNCFGSRYVFDVLCCCHLVVYHQVLYLIWLRSMSCGNSDYSTQVQFLHRTQWREALAGRQGLDEEPRRTNDAPSQDMLPRVNESLGGYHRVEDVTKKQQRQGWYENEQ